MIASIIFDQSISQGRSFFEKSPGDGKRFIDPGFHSVTVLIRNLKPQSLMRLPKYTLKMAKIAELCDDVIDRYWFFKSFTITQQLQPTTFHLSPRWTRSHKRLQRYGWQKISLQTDTHTHTHTYSVQKSPLCSTQTRSAGLRLRRSHSGATRPRSFASD